LENIQIEQGFIQDFKKIITREVYDTTIDVTDIFGVEEKFNVCKAILCKNSLFFSNLFATNQFEEKITTQLALSAFGSLLLIITLNGYSSYKCDIHVLDLFWIFEGGAKFEMTNWEIVAEDIVQKFRKISKNETEDVINFIYRTYELNILQRYNVIFEQLSFYNNNILKLSSFTKKKISDTHNIIKSVVPLLKERDKEIEKLKRENDMLREDFQDLKAQLTELKDLFTSWADLNWLSIDSFYFVVVL